MPQLHPMLFQNPGLLNGDTILHQHIRSFKTIAAFNQLIAELGEDVAAFMSIITNDHGELPIDLLKTYVPQCHEEYGELYDKLLEMMKPKQYSKMYDSIAQVATATVTGTSQEDIFTRKMNIVIDVANQVRSKIARSYTHPQANTYDFTQHTYVEFAIRKVRHDISLSLEYFSAQNVYEFTTTASLGNCNEFADCVYYLLSKIETPIQAEVIEYSNGDHVFVVVDRNSKGDIKHPETWGDNAIVCDAWMGEVYPAVEMPYKLKNFSRYRQSSDLRMINVLSSYNPRFHQCIENRAPILTAGISSNQFGIFEHNEQKRASEFASSASKRTKIFKQS